MALATLENVTAFVGEQAIEVSLGIEDDGLLVGEFGKVPFVDSEVQAELSAQGCTIRVNPRAGMSTSYFVPESSFASLGGPPAIRNFVSWLTHGVRPAGARVESAAGARAESTAGARVESTAGSRAVSPAA